MEEGFWSTVWQENSSQIEGESLSDGCTTNFTLRSRVLAYQEEPGPKVDGSRDEDDSMDVWLY